MLAAPLHAQEGPAFTVGDIRVEGLQRVTEGTVYNYLPINIGDNLSSQRIREAVRALYDTGFFRDVELRREGNTLIVVVNERPTIESFELKGNKDIKTEDLSKSLRNVGLAQGKTFDRSVLEDVKSFLQDQYGARGKYAARIDAQVEEVPGNRVKIKIDIVEGKRAKIRQINIVGNHTYKEKEILEAFKLKTPNLLSFYKQDDRYSREDLQGDLEILRSFYMDRGYANFEVDSTQVAIAPEKDDIFITVNVNEGEVFKVKEVKLAGTFVVPEALLRRYVLVQPGDMFSRKVITATQELLQNRLGEDGFAFAKVDPVPTTIGDPKNKELSLTFFVDPGNRVYVRHIATTKCCAVKCVSSRAAGSRTPRSTDPSNASSGCRTSRRSNRKPSPWPAPPTWSMSPTKSRKVRPRSWVAASATRSLRLSSSAAITPTPTSWVRAAACPWTSTPAVTARSMASP
jgi:outer membrane protein insertion porin family